VIDLYYLLNSLHCCDFETYRISRLTRPRKWWNAHCN